MTESESNNTVYNITLNQLQNINISMIIIFIIALIIIIIITVYGHKANIKCGKNSKYSFYSIIIIIFLILMWLGGFIPVIGNVLSSLGLIGSIVMIVLAKINC